MEVTTPELLLLIGKLHVEKELLLSEQETLRAHITELENMKGEDLLPVPITGAADAD